MSFLDAIISKLPGIAEPKTHINFKTRLKWTGIILLLFLVLGQITLYGVSSASKQQFQFFEIILGSSIGSLMTLGIGPIVTASIILQLLVGSHIIPWDLKSPEGRKKFQGVQKLLVVFFAVFEAFAYVGFGAIRPASPDAGILVVLCRPVKPLRPGCIGGGQRFFLLNRCAHFCRFRLWIFCV